LRGIFQRRLQRHEADSATIIMTATTIIIQSD